MIYYFDDAKDDIRKRFDTSYLSSKEFEDILRCYKEIPADIDGIFAHDDDVTVFFHDSMDDSERLGGWLEEHSKIAFIQFSEGGNYGQEYTPADEGNADIWYLKKSLFYAHFKQFLKAYKSGVRTLEHFLDEKEDDAQAEEEVQHIVYEFSNEPVEANNPQAVEEFVKSISNVSQIIFDLDQLQPEYVRYMATYIRLSVHRLRKAALCPLLFKGKLSFESYLMDYRKSQSHEVLLWKGSYFVSKTEGDAIENFKPLTAEEYLNDFLPFVKVTANAEIGNHSIANYWGAYVVARHIPKFEQQAESIFMKALEKDALYLKYVITCRLRTLQELDEVINGRGAASKIKKINPIYNEMKLLLVDDQNDIWTDLIRGLMPKAKLTVVGKSNGCIGANRETNFLTQEGEHALNYALDYDLILLDLRLGGVLEEDTVNGDDCSGMKILKDINCKNPGQQVIMFTSSNKAWNLKKALGMASGYYIKESPSQPFTEQETIQNLKDFLDTIRVCFKYRTLKEIIGKIFVAREFEFDNVLVELNVREQLDIIKDLALNKSREVGSKAEDWTYAYIALFQILEIIKRLDGLGEQDGIVDRILDLLEDYEYVFEDDSMENKLFAHNCKRNSIVHKKNNELTSYSTFCDLWETVYKVLNALKIIDDSWSFMAEDSII